MVRLSPALITIAWTIALALTYGPREVTQSPATSKGRKGGSSCPVRISSWNECSKICGIGTSTRVKSKKCRLKQETRLCMIRPCQGNGLSVPWKNRKRRCMATIREKTRRHLEYIGSKSVKAYKMKFCGGCRDRNKCCTAHKTKTKKVWFRRSNGRRFAKKMMFIRKCRCSARCPPRLIYGPPTSLFNDTIRAPTGNRRQIRLRTKLLHF